MIYIEKTKNFEFYSSTSKGAIQGNGYELHKGLSDVRDAREGWWTNMVTKLANMVLAF